MLRRSRAANPPPSIHDQPTEAISMPAGWTARSAPVPVHDPGPIARPRGRPFPSARRAIRIVAYCTGLVQGLLMVRCLFLLIGANPAAPAASAVYAFSQPLMAFFEGVLPVLRADRYVLDLSIPVAIAAYTLLGFGLRRLAALWTPKP